MVNFCACVLVAPERDGKRTRSGPDRSVVFPVQCSVTASLSNIKTKPLRYSVSNTLIHCVTTAVPDEITVEYLNNTVPFR